MRARFEGILMLAVVATLAGGCMNATAHQKRLSSTAEREMTLGVVQKEIRLGMSQADVATALGSPNIVTRDSTKNETWIYDKIATEVSYSRDSGGIGIIGLLIGTGSAGAGAASGSYNKEAGASSSTQRTLTVVIRFDSNGLVQSTSYHASKF